MKTIKRICFLLVIIFSCLMQVNGNSEKIMKNSFENVETQRKIDKSVSEIRKVTRNKKDTAYYDDGYVMEDMKLAQQDQPSFMRPQYSYGQMQKEPSQQDKFEQRKRVIASLPSNVQFTKEILIKQGRLKGVIRSMHPQTGLKNVRQYLGIPYAAAPIGNGRFMPPGLFSIPRILIIFNL